MTPSVERVAHRVVKIKLEGGIHYYWPKGDNAEEADGCWIPETNIYAYIIKVHKNTHPYKADLRNSVNDAKAEFEKTRTTWRQKRTEYCGPDDTKICYLAQEKIDELDRLFQVHTRAFDRYTCWLKIARTEEDKRGSIQVYPICF